MTLPQDFEPHRQEGMDDKPERTKLGDEKNARQGETSKDKMKLDKNTLFTWTNLRGLST